MGGVTDTAGEGPEAVEVEADTPRERLDRLLARRLPDLSRSRLKALIEAGQVRIGGRTMTDAAHRVNAGDVVALTVPAPEDPTPQGEDIPLAIVHEDEALIVIDKPAGLVVHPAAGNWTGTLVNALIAHCGDSLSGSAESGGRASSTASTRTRAGCWWWRRRIARTRL